jgi:SHS2 domain-containing protein
VQRAQDALPFVREIQHTADVGFQVEAPTRDGCFERAALALADVIADTSTVVPRERRELRVAGDDAESRLHELLHSVLLLAQVEGFLVSAAEVSAAGACTLRAVVAGERYDPARHHLRGEVKAVTWHQLCVEPTGDGWRARVILDV